MAIHGHLGKLVFFQHGRMGKLMFLPTGTIEALAQGLGLFLTRMGLTPSLSQVFHAFLDVPQNHFATNSKFFRQAHLVSTSR
jgi:hypothetical protein